MEVSVPTTKQQAIHVTVHSDLLEIIVKKVQYPNFYFHETYFIDISDHK